MVSQIPHGRLMKRQTAWLIEHGNNQEMRKNDKVRVS